MRGTDYLKSLHTTLIDAENGYETAIKDAPFPEMRALLEKMSALHALANRDVRAILLDKGERPNESGSFLSLVPNTIISVRSAVEGLDRSSLPSFLDGEERVVGAYDRAIAEFVDSDRLADTLGKHRLALLAAIAEMKARAA